MANTQENISESVDKTVESLSEKHGLKAVDVLREVMLHHHNKAQDVIASIIVLLEDDPKPRGDFLTHMHKEYERARDIAVDCAAKLAAYESPKLQSMEVKQENVHRFVMHVPMQTPTKDEWMKQVGASENKQEPELPNLTSDVYTLRKPQIDFHGLPDDNDIEDAQIIDQSNFEGKF